nr:aminotransferase class V-fold PLP-dependent enzyme [Nocardia arthritidis]
MVDWVADYWERVESLPVSSTVAPGAVRARLPSSPPEQGEPFPDLLDDMDRIIVPGLTHWQHPGFFAYYPTGASGPAALGDLLASGLGVQGMLWQTSPACTELEQHVLDWLAGLIGLPERFTFAGTGGGVVQDAATSAMLVTMLAALYRASGGQVARNGIGRGRYVVYTSAEANCGFEKAARVAGLGSSAVRFVETGDDLAMDPEALRAAMEHDVALGFTPVLVMATVGTTSTGAIDPVALIGPVCREYGAWLHVDAAYAGVAAICPELRWIHAGVAEFADSYATNPHKWLLTALDFDACYVADRGALTGALSVLPEYLRNAASESGAVVDYRDWAGAAGTQVPGVEAVGGDPLVRRGRFARAYSAQCGIGPAVRLLGRSGRPLRSAGAASTVADLFSVARRRCRESGTARCGQRDRASVSVTHQGSWCIRTPAGGRRYCHPAGACRRRVGAAQRTRGHRPAPTRPR